MKTILIILTVLMSFFKTYSQTDFPLVKKFNLTVPQDSKVEALPPGTKLTALLYEIPEDAGDSVIAAFSSNYIPLGYKGQDLVANLAEKELPFDKGNGARTISIGLDGKPSIFYVNENPDLKNDTTYLFCFIEVK